MKRNHMTAKPKKRRRIRRSKNSRNYFTKVHEDAIIEFNNTTDLKRRETLYTTLIGPALNEMVDKIVFTYRFTSLPNIDALRDECKIWLVTILEKFKPEKGSKAFSYFSVVTKNWFIQQVKKNKKKNQREIEFENLLRSLFGHCRNLNPKCAHLEKMAKINKMVIISLKILIFA